MKREAFLLSVALACASATSAPTPSASQFNLGTTVLSWSGLTSEDDSTTYAGLHGQWEYTMPSGVVLNVNGIYSPSLTSTDASNSLSSGLSHVEARVGMQMTASGHVFVPYVSLGQHQISSTLPVAVSKSAAELASATANQTLTWQYAGLGLQGSYAVGPGVTLGYRAATLGHLSSTVASSVGFSTSSSDLGSTWGYEFSTPITLSTSDASTSVVIEPGFTKLDASSSGQILHAKVSLQKSF